MQAKSGRGAIAVSKKHLLKSLAERSKISIILFGISLIILGIFSSINYERTVERLCYRNIPGPIVLIFPILWMIIALPGLVVMYFKLLKIKETEYPISLFLPQIVFMASLFFAFLSCFNSENNRLLFAIDYFASLCILMQNIILIRITKRAENNNFGIYFNRAQHIFVNILVFFSTFLLASIFIELAFRFITHTKVAILEEGYGERSDFVLSPYLMFAEPNTHEGGTLNSQGFLGEELSPVKKSNEIRIAIIGSSAVWAGKNKFSIAKRLEEYLQEYYSGKAIKVINYGRQAYISAQELILLQRYILPLNFDLVIVYNGFNDLWIAYQHESVGVPYLYSNLKKYVNSNAKVLNIAYILNKLSGKSAVVNHLLKNSKKVNKIKARKNFSIEECAGEYRRNLYQMAILARAYNTKVIFSTQPFIGIKGSIIGREKTFLSPEELSSMTVFYGYIADVAKKNAVETNCHYVNMFDCFHNVNEEVFSDAVHVYVRYNSLIARELADKIIDYKIIESK